MGIDQVTRGERSRQAVLTAAYDLFLEHGYAATSMRQIAGSAGLALGGIYNHFAGKEAIFSSLIQDLHPYHQILPIMLSTDTRDPEQFVRLAARTMVDELGRHPDFIKLMMIELVEFNGRNMPGIIAGILPQVLPLIQQLNFSGKRLKQLDPLAFFRALLGLFFSYYITDMLIAGTPLAFSSKDSLDQFIEIFLHGILSEGGTA